MTVANQLEGDACLGRRERKKRSTRLALKAAALDLAAERGYANVTVEDIAEAVDVSVRTFFNYFPSKEAAIVGEDPELIVAMKAEVVALAPELSPLETLRTVLFGRLAAIEEDLDLSGEDHEVWMRRFSLLRSQPDVLVAYTKHLALLEHALADGLLERLGSDESHRVYAALVASSAIGVMRVASTHAHDERSTRSMREIASEGFDLLAAGFAHAPAAPPEFEEIPR
jgi:AcrR family transcriptional regulator